MPGQHRFWLLPLLYCASIGYAADFDVVKFGAKADGVAKDTQAVQAAIDAAAENHGGRVVIPAGKTIVVGTIYLKSFVTLEIEEGAILLGSPHIADYATDTHKNMYKNEPHMDRCLIFAKDSHSFSIQGRGKIDGNGHVKNFNRKTGRPMLIRFMNCRDIQLTGIEIVNPAAWTSAWLYCDEIKVDRVRIQSRVNNNGDGLDFDGCASVCVSNCSFDTSDDSICLQASRVDKPCRDIAISNCHFISKWAGIRIGLLSRGDFESVVVTNCTFRDIDDSGLKIQMNEGGTMRNMTFSNLTMRNVPRPILMTFCQQRACVDAPEALATMKSMQNFSFQNIVIDNSTTNVPSAIFLTGMPGHTIDNVMLSDIQFTIAGDASATTVDLPRVKEFTPEVLDGWWPEFSLVGLLPSHGIYARHMQGLRLKNINITTIHADPRPAVVFNDVSGSLSEVYSNGVLVREAPEK